MFLLPTLPLTNDNLSQACLKCSAPQHQQHPELEQDTLLSRLDDAHFYYSSSVCCGLDSFQGEVMFYPFRCVGGKKSIVAS